MICMICMNVCLCVCVCVYVCIICMYDFFVFVHVCVCICMHVCMYDLHACMICMYDLYVRFVCMNKCMHVYMYACTYDRTCRPTMLVVRTRTGTHTRTHTYAYTFMHARTRTRTQLQTDTHTHIATCAYLPNSSAHVLARRTAACASRGTSCSREPTVHRRARLAVRVPQTGCCNAFTSDKVHQGAAQGTRDRGRGLWTRLSESFSFLSLKYTVTVTMTVTVTVTVTRPRHFLSRSQKSQILIYISNSRPQSVDHAKMAWDSKDMSLKWVLYSKDDPHAV
jgi:hypothetical protein